MINSILVPLVGRGVDKVSLETAYGVAKLFNAHVDCVYVQLDPAEIVARASSFEAGGLLLSQEVWDLLEQDDKKYEAASVRTFDEFKNRRGIAVAEAPPSPGKISIAYHETRGNFTRRVIEASRTRDLVVMGREADLAALSASEFGDVLVGNGKPLLVGLNVSGKAFNTIAIAWKPTTEAARAVTAAMPLLEKASKVVVISGVEGGDDGLTMKSMNHLAVQLGWHGITCETRCVRSAKDVAASLVDCAVRSGADLLVMGGYGHSRAREFVLGGFTRHVLTECAIPVFMCH